MTALCKTRPGRGNIELREKENPAISENEVLIKVKAAGICGSDIHIYNWDTQVKMSPPVVMGHEFSGVAEEVGSAVEGIKPGDRVTAEPSYSVCGRCGYCMEGRYNLCEDRKVMGFWADGAFAEYTAAPAHRIHKLPENISFEEGALTEPFACTVHGVHELVKVRFGENVIVTGPGAIGLLAAQTALAEGARVTVIGTEADAKRLELADKLGVHRTVNLRKEDAAKVVRETTSGKGADVALECSGAEAAVDFNLENLRKGGRFLQLGLFGKPIRTQFELIAYKELEIYGSFAQKWSAWKLALDMMKKQKVTLGPVISDRLPLSDWETGFMKMNNKDGMKIILVP
jgi:L-iditol 2-dehydrogenase